MPMRKTTEVESGVLVFFRAPRTSLSLLLLFRGSSGLHEGRCLRAREGSPLLQKQGDLNYHEPPRCPSGVYSRSSKLSAQPPQLKASEPQS